MVFTLRFCVITPEAFTTDLALRGALSVDIQMIFGVQKLTCTT